MTILPHADIYGNKYCTCDRCKGSNPAYAPRSVADEMHVLVMQRDKLAAIVRQLRAAPALNTDSLDYADDCAMSDSYEALVSIYGYEGVKS